ncbi:MAG: histidine triad nucleotide-binding protein [Clostridia bacterium]
MDCIFCKIVSGEIPSKKVYEDDDVLAFYDLEPQAPVHILVIPKMHITSADEASEETELVIGKCFTAVAKISKALDLCKGYRLVTNVGEHGCQSVKHLHFHILGGKQLKGNMA